MLHRATKTVIVAVQVLVRGVCVCRNGRLIALKIIKAACDTMKGVGIHQCIRVMLSFCQKEDMSMRQCGACVCVCMRECVHVLVNTHTHTPTRLCVVPHVVRQALVT